MKQIIEYIQKKESEGLDSVTISNNLEKAGWSKELIEKAVFLRQNPDIPVPDSIELTEDSNSKKAQKIIQNSVDLNLWDAFEHVLMFISLFVFAIALLFLLNRFVDIFFPNPIDLQNEYYMSSSWYDESVKVPLSTIIVSFPLFFFMFIRIQKRTHENPLLRKMLLRKILIYITLIVTFITLLYNVITIIFNLLNGDLTTNFILHFLVTVSICSFVFGYFVRLVKDDQKS